MGWFSDGERLDLPKGTSRPDNSSDVSLYSPTRVRRKAPNKKEKSSTNTWILSKFEWAVLVEHVG